MACNQTAPGIPQFSFSISPRPVFAATDLSRSKVEGLAATLAKPHETIDTGVVTAHIITALQTNRQGRNRTLWAISWCPLPIESSSKALSTSSRSV